MRSMVYSLGLSRALTQDTNTQRHQHKMTRHIVVRARLLVSSRKCLQQVRDKRELGLGSLLTSTYETE
jgi:hypothetical protein